MARGRLADAEGDPEDAMQLLDQAERRYLPGFFPDVHPIARLLPSCVSGLRLCRLLFGWR